MRKVRIINVLLILFVITSCVMLCGCSIVGEDGKLELFVNNKKKQEKVLNDIIDNLDDITTIKEHYVIKCEFDKSMNGVFDEEYNVYDENYFSQTFHGEYKHDPDDKDALADRVVDYTEYYYLTQDQLIEIRIEDGKYVSNNIIRNLAEYMNYEYDALPKAMNKGDDSWKQAVKLQKADKKEVYFKFNESIETTYNVNGKAIDCKIEGDYCVYINQSRITKVVCHLTVYFTKNPINSTPYGEYTEGIVIDEEAIFEYDSDKSYDDILDLFNRTRIHKLLINIEGNVNDNPTRIGTVCKVEYIEGNKYKATAKFMIDYDFTFNDGFYLIMDVFMDIKQSGHRELQKRIKYQEATIEVADGISYANGCYHTNNDYLIIEFEFDISIDQANYIDYSNIKIKIS